MMDYSLPADLKAEILLNRIPSHDRHIEICGSHRRNAYQDILGFDRNDKDEYEIAICKDGLYDILPEVMFHPVDRFENIPANEYRERFRAEYEKEQEEEANARRFFRPFDTFLLGISCCVSELAERDYAHKEVLVDMICDTMPETWCNNRFVKATLPFVPICRNIRGNKTLITLMLRKVLFEEDVQIEERRCVERIRDDEPAYNSRLDNKVSALGDTYLGNEFDEEVLAYTVHYWNDEICNEQFLTFIAEMEEYEIFLNEYFVGIESKLRFDITTDAPAVRLSVENNYNYLNYNVNI